MFDQKMNFVSPPVRALEFNEYEISNLRTVSQNIYSVSEEISPIEPTLEGP